MAGRAPRSLGNWNASMPENSGQGFDENLILSAFVEFLVFKLTR
jgi:hypothetical protein